MSEYNWTFSDELEKETLIGLHRIAINTAMDVEGTDVSERLLVRCSAARLAYELYKHYTKQGSPIPDVGKEWKTICQSENEFAEVRNQWIRHDPE